MIPTTPLPGEGTKPYQAFRAYVDMGDERTLAKVAKQLKKSATIMGRWSSKWQWKERLASFSVIAHDQEMEASAQAKLEYARKIEARQNELREEEWLLHQEMIFKGREMLRQPMGTSTPAHAAKLLEGGSMLGRMSAEMPTSRAELTGKGGKPLNSELPAPIIQVIIQRDAATDELRKQFGDRPKSRGG